MKTTNNTDSLKSMGDCLMNIGAELMSARANTGRIQLTIERISKMWGIKTELMITNRVLLITVFIPESDQFITSLNVHYLTLPISLWFLAFPYDLESGRTEEHCRANQ